MALIASTQDGASTTCGGAFAPSAQQAAFLDELGRGDTHLVLEARAGSRSPVTSRRS